MGLLCWCSTWSGKLYLQYSNLARLKDGAHNGSIFSQIMTMWDKYIRGYYISFALRATALACAENVRSNNSGHRP